MQNAVCMGLQCIFQPQAFGKLRGAMLTATGCGANTGLQGQLCSTAAQSKAHSEDILAVPHSNSHAPAEDVGKRAWGMVQRGKNIKQPFLNF